MRTLPTLGLLVACNGGAASTSVDLDERRHDTGRDASHDTDTQTDTDTGATVDSGPDTADSAADTAVDSGDPSPPTLPTLVINELLAANDSLVSDEHGEFDDFLEVYNYGSSPVALGAVGVSNDSEEPWAFRFAADAVLDPGAFLVIWCDDSPEQGPMHAPFTVASNGDAVYIWFDEAGTATQIDKVQWSDPRTADVAAARIPDGSDIWVDTTNATPGSVNQP